MNTLPDSKQTSRSLRNVASAIHPLEAKLAPLVSQLSMMKRNGIESGAPYDRLVRDIASFESKLSPLIARRNELEEPFRKARAEAVAATERCKSEIGSLNWIASGNKMDCLIDSPIKNAISELTKSGMSEKAARKSPIVVALEEKRPEYLAERKAAQVSLAALSAKTTGLLALCDKVLDASSQMSGADSKSASFAGSMRSRVIAIDAYVVAFAIASLILFANESPHTGHILFTIQATVLGLIALVTTAESFLGKNDTPVSSSWWPFVGICAIAPVLLWIDFQPFDFDRGHPGQFIEFCIGALASGYAVAGIAAHLNSNLGSGGETSKSREEEIKDGLDKLQRDVEDDLIEYGKK